MMNIASSQLDETQRRQLADTLRQIEQAARESAAALDANNQVVFMLNFVRIGLLLVSLTQALGETAQDEEFPSVIGGE